MRSSGGGLLRSLRAIGWYMEDFACAQVSMNLLDYRVTSPLQVWETCKALAATFNVGLIGCEVIGLIPESCVTEAGRFALQQQKDDTSYTDAELIYAGISYLKLDQVRPFEPEEKILEHVLRRADLL